VLQAAVYDGSPQEGVAMTITIELPPELAIELKTRAALQGMELETLVLESLR
jgi:hypothetical protein